MVEQQTQAKKEQQQTTKKEQQQTTNQFITIQPNDYNNSKQQNTCYKKKYRKNNDQIKSEQKNNSQKRNEQSRSKQIKNDRSKDNDKILKEVLQKQIEALQQNKNNNGSEVMNFLSYKIQVDQKGESEMKDELEQSPQLTKKERQKKHSLQFDLFKKQLKVNRSTNNLMKVQTPQKVGVQKMDCKDREVRYNSSRKCSERYGGNEKIVFNQNVDRMLNKMKQNVFVSDQKVNRAKKSVFNNSGLSSEFKRKLGNAVSNNMIDIQSIVDNQKLCGQSNSNYSEYYTMKYNQYQKNRQIECYGFKQSDYNKIGQQQSSRQNEQQNNRYGDQQVKKQNDWQVKKQNEQQAKKQDEEQEKQKQKLKQFQDLMKMVEKPDRNRVEKKEKQMKIPQFKKQYIQKKQGEKKEEKVSQNKSQLDYKEKNKNVVNQSLDRLSDKSKMFEIQEGGNMPMKISVLNQKLTNMNRKFESLDKKVEKYQMLGLKGREKEKKDVLDCQINSKKVEQQANIFDKQKLGMNRKQDSKEEKRVRK